MKYPKDAYYLNSELINKKKNEEPLFDETFENMVRMLTGKSVYEVGFDFGQRLLALQDHGVKIVGGVEFDPNFGLYKKHSNLFDHGWDIKFTQLDFWNPKKRKCVITNHFLDLFQEEDRLILLDKLKNMSKELYLNENCELDLPKEKGVYVFANVSGDDIKSDSGTNENEEVELPSFESFKNRSNTTVFDDKDAGENEA